MKNFAEVWLARVIQLLTTANVAPWLDGIEELDTDMLIVHIYLKYGNVYMLHFMRK